MSVFNGRMAKQLGVASLAIAATVSLVACSQAEEQASPQSESPAASAEPTGDQTISIAVTEDLEQAIELLASQFKADTGNTLDITLVPRNLELAKIQELIQDNPEIDLVLLSHDQVHELAAQQLLAEIPSDQVSSDFVDSALAAFTSAGHLRGIPISIETSAPVCKGETEASEGPVDISRMILEFDSYSGNPYQTNIFRTSFGLSMLDEDPAGGFLDEPALFGPEAIDYANWLSGLADRVKLVESGKGVDALIDSEDGCLFTGPYDIPRIVSAGLTDYSIQLELPMFGIAAARPFVEARGFAVISGSQELDLAVDFATEYLSSVQFQQAVYDTTGQVSPVLSVEQSSDAKAFQLAAVGSQPRPGNALINSYWGPLGLAEAQVVLGSQTPEDAWSQLQAQLGN